MADERLTDRTTLSELADGDLIHVVDISDTTDNPLGTSKKGLWSLFKSTLLTYFNTQYLRSVTGDSVNNADPLNPVVNAIPLSGTTSGNPVSGDVLFGAGVKAKFQRIGGSNTFSIYNNFGQIRLEDDTTGFYLNLINSSFSFRNQNFISTLSNLSLTANRSYNLPDKNGTFAMLDDIPADGPYLPLAGGTMTGNLFIEGDSTPVITITDTTNNLAGRIRVANTFMYIDADNSDTVSSTRILLRTDGVEALRLDENQNATFGGTIAVQGTGDSSFAGNVGINTTSPTAKLHVVGLPTYADNATALAGGLTVGAFYHTAGVLKVVI
jgi:hypothetical protein